MNTKLGVEENLLKVHTKIDKALKILWEKNIIEDYNNDFLLKEDTLKNAIYHHLRNQLGDGFLRKHRLRIYTEYHLGSNKDGKKQIADIAIVQLSPKKRMDNSYHIHDRVEQIITIMELKFKATNERVMFDDVTKLRDYTKMDKCKSCSFYLGFICERYYKKSIGSWLHPTQKNNWAKNRVTELTAHYCEETDEFVSNIISHTQMNKDLDES